MLKRRRKQLVQWFPPLGTEPDQTGVVAPVDFPGWPATQNLTLTISGNQPDTAVVGLTWDFPTEQSVVANAGIPSLADWQGSAYRLRRIVGKCFLTSFQADPQTDGTPTLIVTAGFIVLKVEEDTGAPLATDVSGYDPDTVGAARDPWIWRRAWQMSPQAAAAPNWNGYNGSVLDGPHIDAKTNRRVADEERLFFVISARNDPPDIDNSGRNSLLAVTLDYRLLGSVMKQTNRRNASR